MGTGNEEKLKIEREFVKYLTNIATVNTCMSLDLTFNSRWAWGPVEIASKRSWSCIFSFFNVSIRRSRFIAAFFFSHTNSMRSLSSFRSCKEVCSKKCRSFNYFYFFLVIVFSVVSWSFFCSFTSDTNSFELNRQISHNTSIAQWAHIVCIKNSS